MKVALYLLFYFVTYFITLGQDSFYLLNINKIEKENQQNKMEQKYVGTYDLDGSKINQLVVTEDSIYVKLGQMMVFSNQLAKEKGYSKDGTKIYGVFADRGLFYKEENDTIYAFYYQNVNLWDKESVLLNMGGNSFVILSPNANDFYNINTIVFDNNEVRYNVLDEESSFKLLEKQTPLQKKQIANEQVPYFTPDFKVLKKVFKKFSYSRSDIYAKNK